MEIKKEQENKLLLYAMYTILYLNDTACNCVKELEPYIANKDKETKKIYGALKKRVNTYFNAINKVVDKNIDYLADYCSEMDDICYDSMLNFKNALYDVYCSHTLDDSEYYTQVETMRSMVEMSKFATNKVIDTIKYKVPNTSWLSNYMIPDFSKIANNFADWVYRKTPKDIQINFNEDSETMKYFREMSSLMVDFKSFDAAYTKAAEYEKERKKNI